MRNQEKKNQDQKLLNFTPNLLQCIQSIDANRLNEITQFFKNAFLELTSNELFDDEIYRQEWLDNISVIENLAFPFQELTTDELQTAIKVSQLKLSKESEANHA